MPKNNEVSEEGKEEETNVEEETVSAPEGDASLEEALKENARTFAASALQVYERGDTTSATILYFKALFAVLDFIILKKRGLVPKDHSERFRILEKYLPDLYAFVDSNSGMYQDTYRAKIAKEDCDSVKEYVEKLIAEQEI